MKDKNHHILSILAIMISLFSVAFVGGQTIDDYRHNRLSVMPLLSFVQELDENAPEVGLRVKNVGSGPALIKWYKIYVDEIQVKNWEEAAERVDVDASEIATLEFEKDDSLGAGQSELLLSLPTDDDKNLNRFVDLVDKRIDVSIKYCSIYNECQIRCSQRGHCP